MKYLSWSGNERKTRIALDAYLPDLLELSGKRITTTALLLCFVYGIESLEALE